MVFQEARVSRSLYATTKFLTERYGRMNESDCELPRRVVRILSDSRLRRKAAQGATVGTCLPSISDALCARIARVNFCRRQGRVVISSGFAGSAMWIGRENSPLTCGVPAAPCRLRYRPIGRFEFNSSKRNSKDRCLQAVMKIHNYRNEKV